MQRRRIPCLLCIFALTWLSVWQAQARTQPFDFPLSVDAGWSGAEAVAVGDVDGDGRLDLVSAGAGGVAWWREEMGLYTKTTIDAGAALDVDLRDVDGDGDLDVVIATATSLLLGKSSSAGTSWAISTVQATIDAKSVELADLDGDGKVDVLAAFATGVDWWRNTAGDGTAFARTTIGTLTSGSSAAAGDFDLDGDLDVVSSSDGSSDRLRYFDNLNGLGTSWSAGDVALAQDGARSVVVADFDADGYLDVAAALLGAGETRVYRNDHTPGDSVWAQTLATSSASPRQLAVADFDLDGDVDLLVCGGSLISWLEQTSRSPLGFTSRFLVSPLEAQVVAPGDFDGDGDIDIMFGGSGKEGLVFYPNQSPRQSFLARPKLDLETVDGARALAAGDLDNDGDIDLVVAAYASTQVRWQENTPAGWVSHALPGALSGAFGVAIADLDGDGDLEVLAAGDTANSVVWWENGWPLVNSFTRANIDTTLVGARGVAVGDIDRDGDLDVVAAGVGDDLALYKNNGPATSFTRADIETAFNRAQSVDLADMDGDGDLDVLAAGETADEIAWWQNTAGGTSWTKRVISGATIDGAYSARAADIDGDGDMDAISTAEFADKISYWSNDGGDGLTWTEHSLGFFNQAEAAEVGDFDGDGDLDIVGAAWKDGGKVAFFRNNDSLGTSWTKIEISGTFDGAGSLAVADFDANGLPDIAASAETLDQVSLWLNGGGQYAFTTLVLSGSSLPANTETSLFRLQLTPRGLLTENEVELAQIELKLEEAPGDPLSAGEANALLQQIEILRDNPSGGTAGVLDGTDISLATLSSFAPSPAGVVLLAIADNTPFASVSQGAIGTFFVTVTTAPSYASLAIQDLRITHLSESTSRAEDQVYDTDLRQEWALNGVTALFPINSFANLALDVVDDADPVAAGGNLTYTVSVTNNGPDVATGVVLSSVLPGAATLVASTGCVEDPAGAPSCTLGSIGVGVTQQVTLVVAVAASASGSLTYQAQAAGSLFDPALGDNSSSEATAVIASADVAIDLSSPMADFADGAPLHWRATVSNNGPGPTTGAAVSVDLPAGLSSVFWTCTASVGAACGSASGSGDITAALVNLPAGGSVVYRIRSQVPVGATSAFSASASVVVGAGANDAVPGNNSDGLTLLWGASLFYDGFESGNSAGWSLTTP